MKFSCSECGLDIVEGAEVRFLILAPADLFEKLIGNMTSELMTLNALIALPRFIVCPQHVSGVELEEIPASRLIGLTFPVGYCRDSLPGDPLKPHLRWLLEARLRQDYLKCMSMSRKVSLEWIAATVERF